MIGVRSTGHREAKVCDAGLAEVDLNVLLRCKIHGMPNIALVLKDEISRLARKETRSETETLKKAVSQQRTDIATLKKRVQELEKALKAQLRLASGKGQREATAAAQPDGDGAAHRFRAAGMANNRKRLGLSAEDFGLLVGASGQSIYNWESGKAKPRAKNLPAIAALRGIGKREVARQLEALKQSTG